MLALIAFALITLAWSWFKQCRTGCPEEEINNTSSEHHHNVEHGDGGKSEMMKNMAELSDAKNERVIVIMAGDEKPTAIALATSVGVRV